MDNEAAEKLEQAAQHIGRGLCALANALEYAALVHNYHATTKNLDVVAQCEEARRHLAQLVEDEARARQPVPSNVEVP